MSKEIVFRNIEETCLKFPDSITVNGVELYASVDAYDGVKIPVVEYYGAVYTDEDDDEFTYCIRVYTESTQNMVGWNCEIVRTCPYAKGLVYTYYKDPRCFVSSFLKEVNNIIVDDLVRNAKGYRKKEE